MTNKNVTVTEEMAITAAVAAGKVAPPRGNSANVNFANYKKYPTSSSNKKKFSTQLELNGSSGRMNVVDSMKVSSPTHIKSNSLLPSPVVAEKYKNWMVSFF